MKNKFELVHVGINNQSSEEAEKLAALLRDTFNLTTREGNNSIFVGEMVECKRTPYFGAKGHIALCTENLEAAMEELKEKGFSFIQESALYDEQGKIKNIYIDYDFGGFAIHVSRK